MKRDVIYVNMKLVENNTKDWPLKGRLQKLPGIIANSSKLEFISQNQKKFDSGLKLLCNFHKIYLPVVHHIYVVYLLFAEYTNL